MRVGPWTPLALAVAALSRPVEARTVPDVAAVEAKAIEVARAATPKTVAVRIELDGNALGYGSGAVVSADGLVLTCAHVTEPAAAGRLVAVFADGMEAPLVVVASNARNDLALCRTEPPSKGLPHFEVAPEDPVLGDYVVALGHPGGPFPDRMPSVSVGKVTGVRRQLPVFLQGKDYVDAIQTDAPLFGGNSGGPLVDLEGRLVGINGAIVLVGDATFSASSGQIRADLPLLREGKNVPGKRIAATMEALRDLASEMDLSELADAIADENLKRILQAMTSARSEDAVEDEDEPAVAAARVARRIDDLRDVYETSRRWDVECAAVIRGGTRVGYATLVEAKADGTRWVTSARVVGDGKDLALRRAPGNEIPVRLLGRDGAYDVALLVSPERTGYPYRVDAATAVPGSWVVMPDERGRFVQAGSVCAIGREVGTERRTPTVGIMQLFASPNTTPFRPFSKVTQVDAALEADQMGIPVLRTDGSLVGVAVAHFHRGCTIVVPAATIFERLEGLEAGSIVEGPPVYGPKPRPPKEAREAATAPAAPRRGLASLYVPTLSGVPRRARFRDPDPAAPASGAPRGAVCFQGTGAKPFSPREGDVLFSVAGAPTPDAASARKALAALPADRDSEIGLMRYAGPSTWKFEALVARPQRDGDVVRVVLSAVR